MFLKNKTQLFEDFYQLLLSNAGLTPITEDIFILNCSGDSLPVKAIVTTSRGAHKQGSFLVKQRLAVQVSVIQLQTLVIRHSH